MGETVNSSHVVEIEGSTSFNNDTTAIIADDILMDEILPRLPIKSLCRFKLVCKQWNNFITHPSHRFAISHHRYASKNLSNSAYFFNEQTERVCTTRRIRSGVNRMFVVQVIPSESKKELDLTVLFLPGGKVYWSYVRHIVWFDVEKDQAGSIECPGKDNLIFVHGLYCYSEIGVCDGELSYSKATNEGNIEIWLLKSKSGDYVGIEFEWVKIFNLSLEEIFQENWNVVSKFFWTRKSRTPKKAAEFSTKKRAILPLPCLDKEVVWFWMDFGLKEYCRNGKLFYINIRSRELKLLDGDFSIPQYLFSASFLSCPT
ncbi:hypothetical protein Sjap_005453 [Stephania japonica]|uniref:F-box domain-containing protein n=1 Tax=Stephania japonica TaxID=461633 RepID=A0AAP0K571_9MAGN